MHVSKSVHLHVLAVFSSALLATSFAGTSQAQSSLADARSRAADHPVSPAIAPPGASLDMRAPTAAHAHRIDHTRMLYDAPGDGSL